MLTLVSAILTQAIDVIMTADIRTFGALAVYPVMFTLSTTMCTKSVEPAVSTGTSAICTSAVLPVMRTVHHTDCTSAVIPLMTGTRSFTDVANAVVVYVRRTYISAL